MGRGALEKPFFTCVLAVLLDKLALPAPAGTGAAGGKKFGFASCERPIGNAEGVNVLVERRVGDGKYTYGVSNVEYTEFERIGLKDAVRATARRVMFRSKSLFGYET